MGVKPPRLFDPDFELLAVAELLSQVFSVVDIEDRPEILQEAGQRLSAVGDWLQADEAWCPLWPNRPIRRSLMAKKRNRKHDQSDIGDGMIARKFQLLPDLPVATCGHDVREGHERFHQLGYHSHLDQSGVLRCSERAKYSVQFRSEDGEAAATLTLCPWHYSMMREKASTPCPTEGQLSTFGVVYLVDGELRANKPEPKQE